MDDGRQPAMNANSEIRNAKSAANPKRQTESPKRHRRGGFFAVFEFRACFEPGISGFGFRDCCLARAFTLLETMVALMVMGIIAAAVALSAVRPARLAGLEDAAGSLAHFDATVRQRCCRHGEPARLLFDVDANRIDAAGGDLRRSWTPPGRCRIGELILPQAGGEGDGVRLQRGSSQTPSVREGLLAAVRISDRGLSRSYIVRIDNPSVPGGEIARRWVLVAGLTGQAVEIDDGQTVEDILSLPSGRDDAR